MKKRLFALLLALALCGGALPAASAASVIRVDDVNIMVKGNTFAPTDANGDPVRVFAYNGTTYAPLRALAEAYGLEVGYSAQLQCAYVCRPGEEPNLAGLKLGSLAGGPSGGSGGTSLAVSPVHIVVNGKQFKPKDATGKEVPVFASGGTTYAPLRALAEAYGLEVGYDAARKLAYVTDPKGGNTQGKTLVSAAAPVESKSITKASVSVQDMYNYMPKSMTFDKIDKNEEGQQYRKFRGGEDSYDLIKGYVDALCATGNFTQTDDYYFNYKDTFFEFALTYTGTGRVSGDKPEMTFKPGVTADVTVYGTLEGSSCEGYIYIVKGLEFDDLGLRSTGSAVSTALPGKSLYTDLYRLADGSYETGDGRFHVSVGNAQVYRDGTAYTAPATLLRNQDKNREELHIDNFYRNDSILFTAPYNSLLTGDTFDTRSIGLNERAGYEKYVSSMASCLDWTFSSKMVAVCHNGDYLFCYRDGGNDFEQVAVRVMYWDAAGREAVIYLCATFDSAPYEFEALAAVKMETAQPSPSTGDSSGGSIGGGSGPFVPDFAKPDCPTCDGDGDCPTCGGDGYLWSSASDKEDRNCWKCGGDGNCPTCHGTGKRT